MNRFSSCVCLAISCLAAYFGVLAQSLAQTNYENYTFVTLTGPSESPGWYDGNTGNARLANPFGVAMDNVGNLYVADTYNHTIRKITPSGDVATLAGSPTHPGTNDGAGSRAKFNYPKGVTVDKSGNVFVADTSSHTIRKITPLGVVTTLAGSPTVSGTNNGLGDIARFNYPIGVAVDAVGDIFVADSYNHTIREITSNGVVSTFAGAALLSGTNNGTGAGARFNTPFGVALDTNQNVYVADTYNHTIRIITSAGVVSTIAGTPTVSGTNSGTGSAARFNYPTGVAVDINRNVYVADYSNETIRKVSTAGVVTNLAGVMGVVGYTNGTGSIASFYLPTSLTVDGAGTVYIADSYNNLIRKITPAALVSTFAGSPGGSGAADQTGSDARFNYPAGVVVDVSNNVYVADYANHTIRKITAGRVVATYAGQSNVSGTNNGANSAARFYYPTGVAVDTNGTLFVADTYNHVIRKITSGGVVSTFAGTATQPGTNNGTGIAARFNYPFAIAVGTNSTVFVADSYSHTIRKITSAGVVTTLAGSPTLAGTNDGVGNFARFNYPEGIAADAAGNVYVADDGNHTIRKVTSLGEVTTLAGSPGIAGFADGIGSNALFYSPFGVAVDDAGSVYVSDYNNSLIRKITPSGTVTTLAGSRGTAGFLDGSGISAHFNSPEGLAVGKNGTLYLADAGNHAIRKGYLAPADLPVVDMPIERPGVVRHLSVSNLTTTSWSWSIVRRPANSLSQLSSTNDQSSAFTPDLSETYTIRFQGADGAGRQAIGTLDLVGSGNIDTRISDIRKSGNDIVLTGFGGAPGASYSVLVSTDLGVASASWNVLPGNEFDNSGGFVFTNTVNSLPAFYRIKVP